MIVESALSYTNAESRYMLLNQVHAIIEGMPKDNYERIKGILKRVNETIHGAMEDSTLSFIISGSQYVLLNSLTRIMDVILEEMSAVLTGVIEESTLPYMISQSQYVFLY